MSRTELPEQELNARAVAEPADTSADLSLGAAEPLPPAPELVPRPVFRVGHWPFLDGLRGLSVLAVLGVHAQLPYMSAGFLGVDVFFALSGFLITVLLLEEWEQTGRIRLKDFYVRRALRLAPALVALVLATAAYSLLDLPGHIAPYTWQGAAAALLYVTNWAWSYGWVGMTAFTHTWSLAIEEQFYLLWPLLLLGLLRLKLRRPWKVALVAAGIAASIALRLVLWRAGSGLRMFIGIDTRADGLLMGCLVGLVLSWGLLRPTRRTQAAARIAAILAAAYLIAVIAIGVGADFYLSLGLATFPAAASLILLGLFLAPLPGFRRILELRPLVWIGRRSYGLYLWHFPLICMTLPVLGPPVVWPASWLKTSARLALAFLLTAASYAWIERPFLRLKGRFSHKQPGAQAR